MSEFILSAFADEICADLDGQMDVLQTHGIRHIELRAADGKNIAEFTAEEARAALARMKARGFAVSALGSPIGKYPIEEPFEDHFEVFQHVVDLAHILETPYIRVFSFFLPPEEDPAKYRGEVIRRMAMMADYALRHGVILLHENERHIYGDIASRCRDIHDAVPSPALWMTYDPSNFVLCGQRNYPDAYELLRDRVRYMHMKDSVSGSDDLGRDMGFDTRVVTDAHRPVGQGDGDVQKILTALWQSGYEGFLSLEPHLANNDAIPGTGADKFAVAVAALKAMLARVTA